MEDGWVVCDSDNECVDHLKVFRCFSENYEEERCQDDNYETATSVEQWDVEDSVKRCIQIFQFGLQAEPRCPSLNRELHLQFLKKGLHHLPSSLEVLDSSRPWLCYWILHSIELLNEPIPEETKTEVIHFLSLCQHKNGGFAGKNFFISSY
ncbi:protein farnesyltransferase subunit beta [Caerostris darwini]|uniref:Protein farnesyltransferase subunit beta n=1 Tax=Caerostris darwini TaxID=1538125 RepID=A0AAV4VEB5_9ARAC|nr:protein farnesyltransferase subunit beta [Caerostris darwini]